ncbi:MAG: Gfo/Idh/MocA family oxidoreductase [Verrucomicrobiota bacterium]
MEKISENASHTRRRFVKSAAVGASVLAMPHFIRAQVSDPPMSKLNLACVGVGGKGRGDVRDAARYANIVALCDVDLAGSASESVELHPEAKRFTDFRRMLDAMGDKIDGVTITTPDHSHYPIAMAVMERGINVFLQKPLANTIWEARQLNLMAKKTGVVSQMGIQGHTFEGIRLLREWLEADAIGRVNEVRYWTNRPIWPQGIDVQWNEAPVPEGLNWGVWKGSVTREQAYSPDLHPKKWRASWDYGCGALGDIGCHLFDHVFWALDLGYPESVEVESTTDFDDRIAPSHSMIRYRFTQDRLGKKIKPVEFLWSDGGLRPQVPEELDGGRTLQPEFGQLITGTKGVIYSPGGYCETLRLIPEAKMRAFKRPEKRLPRVKGGPIKEWIDAIKGGPEPGANFEYAARLTEVVLLGNLALRLGKPVRWNPNEMKVEGQPEADRMIKREYRDGWSFPELV